MAAPVALLDHGPFTGLPSYDLSGRALSKDEKQWLGRQQAGNIASARELAVRYNLKVDTVRKYALRIVKGRAFTGVSGRPLGSKDKVPRKPPVRKSKPRVMEVAPEEAKEAPDAVNDQDLDEDVEEESPAAPRRSLRNR